MEQNVISVSYGAKYKNYPFYNWVPKPLGIILLILLFIPILTVGGVYTANSGEMTSGLGIQSEHIQFVGFVTSIGMAAFSPFFYQLVCIRREKMMCVVGFSLLYLLSYVCAVTDSIFVLALCSLIMGFLRMVLMMVNLFTLIRYAFGMEATRNITPGNEPDDEQGWDRLDSEKSKSMPIIYLFFMILGQLGTSLTAWLAYEYQWQDVYYYMMGMTLVAILVVLVTMPYHAYNGRRFPITFRKFGNVAVFSSMMTCGIYVLVYGKTLDWMASPRIRIYIVIAPLLVALFLWEQFHSPRPFVSLKPLFQWKAILGYFYMMLVMFFSTSTSLLTSYMTTILHVDNTRTYTIYIWLLPGYVLGAFVCFWWFRWQRWRFRFFIAGGMSCFALFFGMLYFGISPDSTYEMLYLPMFLRGLGMLALIIAFALFAVEDLQPKYLLSNAFFLITFRSVLTPVIASAFYSNTLYRLQQRYMVELSETMSAADPLAASRWQSAFSSALAQGHGADEAVQMATNTLNTILQQQGTLLALKHILGWLFAVTLAIAIISRFIPFHKTVRVPVVRTGEDMV